MKSDIQKKKISLTKHIYTNKNKMIEPKHNWKSNKAIIDQVCTGGRKYLNS